MKKLKLLTNNHHPEDLRLFLSEYEQYIKTVLNPTLSELENYLNYWQKPDYWLKYAQSTSSAMPSPVKAVFTRIKRPERVVDKIIRKPEVFPAGLKPESFERMNDTIGIRILVYFLSQLPIIDKEMRDSNILELSNDYPPEAYLGEDIWRRFGLTKIERKHKESGYSSIHYIARLKRASHSSEKRPLFEIQVQTLAQELWSEMEHILAYKPEKRTNFSAKRRFQILSREISAIDEHFNLLYEELIHNQVIARHENEDPISVENLPITLSEIGIRCAQKDLQIIIKLLWSRKIRTVGDLLNIAQPKRLETIRNTYASTLGRPPSSLELIATLGALQGIKRGKSEVKVITAQIEYNNSWKSNQQNKSLYPDII
ncbi:GTP pyrophosphokinase family protein [candidate division KSB1 bacterium]